MILILGLSLLVACLAAPVTNPIKLDFNVVVHKNTKTSSDIQSKSIETDLLSELKNEYSLYMVEISLGSPAQQLEVCLDTGSSDLWVPALSPNGASKSSTNSDDSKGYFNASASTTYNNLSDRFKISYNDMSSASGEWGNDNINLNGIEVSNMTFGYANDYSWSISKGVFGIGLKQNEASAWPLKIHEKSKKTSKYPGFYYDNYPVLLYKNKLIRKIGYSLYLDDGTPRKGSILFGAVDTAKFDGELEFLDLVKIDDAGSLANVSTGFFVNMSQISVRSKYKINHKNFLDKTYPALLDSGSSLLYVPPGIVQDMQQHFAVYNDTYGGYVTRCDTKAADIHFTFGSKTIRVPFSNLLYNTLPDSQFCALGIASNSKDYFILGEPFLRSSYVFYDLQDENIGLAQAVYTSKSNIRVVE